MILQFLFWLMIVVTGLAATASMTIVTYIVARVTRRNVYVIPVLSRTIAKIWKGHITRSPFTIGRILHYTVGVVFAIIFELLTVNELIPVNYKTGLLFGAVCGTIAVIVWTVIIKQVLEPVSLDDQKLFLLTVWLGHLVFGIVLVLLHFF